MFASRNPEGRVEKSREKTERQKEREREREREGSGGSAGERRHSGEFDLICEAFPLWKQLLMPGGF